MSHHYSGPDFGFPHGDARLDLTDLYAFPKPSEADKSILIMNVHPSAVVHPAGSIDIASKSKKLASLLPGDRREATLVELVPEGSFLTYGIGVSLNAMMDPATALAHVPIG